MVLELTSEQQAFKESVERFARDRERHGLPDPEELARAGPGEI